MKKIIVFNGYNNGIIENMQLFAYVIDLDEQGYNELASTLLRISYKVESMINANKLDIDKVFKGIKLPFKEELKTLYKRHGLRINWQFLPYKGV